VEFKVNYCDDFPLDLIGVFSVLREPRKRNYLITDKNEISENMKALRVPREYAYYIEGNVLYDYADSELNSISVDIGNRIITIGRVSKIEFDIVDGEEYEVGYEEEFMPLKHILNSNIYKEIFSSMNSTDIYNNFMEALFPSEKSTS